jgi:hypothetical protein
LAVEVGATDVTFVGKEQIAAQSVQALALETGEVEDRERGQG